jgi:hypothetical protein
MLNIYIPQPVLADRDDERLVASDLVRVGSQVVLFLAHYADFDMMGVDVELRCGQARLKGTPMGIPQFALGFEVPPSCTGDRFSIYRDGQFCGRIRAQSYRPDRKVRLTMATLFKGDYAQVRTWMDHHAKLGFERFVLYYNGALADILPQLLAQDAILDKDVLLVQWPLSYWVEGTGLGPEALTAEYGDKLDVSKIVCVDQHHAQQLMLHHALVFLEESTEFLGFLDIDEYLKLAMPVGLVDLLRSHEMDVYVFQSRWTELASGRVPRLVDDSFFDAEEVLASHWIPYPRRLKYIARPGCVLGTSAHIPINTTPGTKTVRVETGVAGIYHFHCFSGKAPRRNLVNPSGQWTSIAAFREAPTMTISG